MERKWRFQLVTGRKGYNTQWSRKTEHDRRIKKKNLGKRSLISANSSIPSLGNTHTHQDWHAKSPWHMLARWHPVCSRLARADTHKHTHTHTVVTVATEGGGTEKRGWERSTWSACVPHYKCIHIWVAGWRKGDGSWWETKVHFRKRQGWTDGKERVVWQKRKEEAMKELSE